MQRAWTEGTHVLDRTKICVASRDEVSHVYATEIGRGQIAMANNPDIIDAQAQLYLPLPQRPSATPMQHRTPPLRISYHIYLFFILTLLPGLFAVPPFIFLTEYPLPSALDLASLLFACLFLPPKPNFWSFFARLVSRLGSRPLSPEEGLASLSRATSKRSSSCVLPISAPCRSVLVH